MDIAEKVIVVTGVTGNLGGAVATRARAAGARVVLVGRGRDRIEAAFPDAEADGSTLIVDGVDLADLASCEAAVAKAVDRFGRVDALLNTVGGFAYARFDGADWATAERMLTMNFRSAYQMSKAVLPVMTGQGAGRIVHVGAGAALKAPGGLSAYAASKSAVMRLVEALAEETKGKGVTVNCVLPGIIDTPDNREAMPDADTTDWVSPEAIADVMLFFVGDAARAVTGALVPVMGRG